MPEPHRLSTTEKEVTIQAGFNTSLLFGAAAGSEAYDEPLTGAEATAIASLFIVA
jgi:hypothetical protein